MDRSLWPKVFTAQDAPRLSIGFERREQPLYVVQAESVEELMEKLDGDFIEPGRLMVNLESWTMANETAFGRYQRREYVKELSGGKVIEVRVTIHEGERWPDRTGLDVRELETLII